MANEPRELMPVQQILLERADLLAERQLASAWKLLEKVSTGNADIDRPMLVALMQVLATNYAAEVEKRK